MPTPRCCLAATGAYGYIYAIGGNDSTHTLATVEAYDPARDVWISRAPLPHPVEYSRAVTVNDTIYVLGGYLPNGTRDPSVMVFDPLSNTWTTRSPKPSSLLTPVGVVNGIIYTLYPGDSFQSGTAPPFAYAYDPGTDNWTSLPRPPDYIFGSPATYGATIYFMGGWAGYYNFLNTTLAYQPLTDTWTQEARIPARAGSGAATVSEGIVVVGLMQAAPWAGPGTPPPTQVYEYDPPANNWTEKAPMPFEEWDYGVASTGDQVYVVGGRVTQSYNASCSLSCSVGFTLRFDPNAVGSPSGSPASPTSFDWTILGRPVAAVVIIGLVVTAAVLTLREKRHGRVKPPGP